jgi:hypothetical protein
MKGVAPNPMSLKVWVSLQQVAAEGREDEQHGLLEVRGEIEDSNKARYDFPKSYEHGSSPR